MKNGEGQTQGSETRNGKDRVDSDILTRELAGVGDNYLEAQGKEGAGETSEGSGL